MAMTIRFGRRRAAAVRTKYLKKAVRRYNRRVMRRAPKDKKGYMRLVRRIPETFLQNAVTAGTLTNSPASIINYGTPVATNFANYFVVPGAVTFKLNDIINPQDITNMFDKYRFRWVKLRLYSTSTVASAASTAQLPSIIWNTDDDDSVIPTASFMREKMGSKQAMLYPGKPITIFIRNLKVAASLNTPATTTGVGTEVRKAPFINSSYDNVPHLGLKFALMDVNLSSTSTAYTQFKWDITYCIEGREAQ